MAEWWQEGIVYQIYPRSFQDSNGDGSGDLPGIISRLDYLQWLGVTALWISPTYPSPMADFGYDVSDYTAVDPLFGTLADMEALIAAAHARELRVILDLVPNHSSSEHPWFRESRASRDNPRRDWYYWQDPAPDGGPPNNWLAHFGGGSAWEWDETTGQYYLHLFLAEQPDLNWRNPAVREAMEDVMRFWFDRGVDGFRVDVCYMVMKDPQLRDNPPNPAWRPGQNPFDRLLLRHSQNHPDVHQFNRWLRGVADEYPARVLIGETYLSIPELVAHYGHGDEFHLPFNFHLVLSPWNAAAIRALIDAYEAALPAGAWPNWVLGNHDQHRFATRVGRDQARLGMLLLLTLRGTPTIYYGDELGMVDGDIPPQRIQDPAELNAPGLGLGRDPERTPMQWDGSPQSGFCPAGVAPWLPVNADYASVNVASQRAQPASMLNFTRRLLALRQGTPALRTGGYRALAAPDGILAYAREQDGQTVVVALNFSPLPVVWVPPGTHRVLLTTRGEPGGQLENGRLTLDGYGGAILA